MATLLQDIYNIKNIAVHGKTSTTDALRESQVKHWIQYYRPLAIEQLFKTVDRTTHMLWQKTGCLELTAVDMAECPCEDIMWGCSIFKVDIPKAIDLGSRPAVSVTAVDGLHHIDLVNPSAMLIASHAKWTGVKDRAYLDRSTTEGMMSLYIGSANEDLQYIKVRLIADDPTLVTTMIGSPGSCTERCFDIDKDDYPMTGQVRALVYDMIFKKELALTNQAIEDILNNNNEDRQYLSVKQVLESLGENGRRSNNQVGTSTGGRRSRG
jgi:hypothetical protein